MADRLRSWVGLPLLTFVLGAASMGCAGGPSRDDVQLSQRQYDLGIGLYGEGNLPGAFEHLLEAIRLDPQNAEAHLQLGNLYMIHRSDYQSSEEHYREAIRAHEEAPTRVGLPSDARNSLGVLYIHAGRYQEATEILRESASDLMNRQPAVVWANLGWAYYELERYPEALEVLNQALQLQPDLCVGWYRTGQVRVAQEDFEGAEDALTRALEVEDETCQSLQVAWRLRGEVRSRLGHREEAVEDLERCVELSSDTEDGVACRELLGTMP